MTSTSLYYSPGPRNGSREAGDETDARRIVRNVGFIQDMMQKKSPVAPESTPQAVALRMAVRKLWTDHVVWTREYIVAAVAGTPDASAAAKRLLRNQEDIGNAIAQHFGAGAGAAVEKLLKEHITIAVDLVAAAKSSDNAAFARHDARWTANAGAIADLLAGASAHWPRKDVFDLLALHLSLTKAEAVARLTKDWDADVRAFDDILVEAMTIADAISAGILKQFPERFAGE